MENQNLKTVKSFVSSADEAKVLEIVSKVKNETFRDEVSVLVLYGSGPNGKTVLSKVLERIAPSSARLHMSFDEFMHTRAGGLNGVKSRLEVSNNSLIIANDYSVESIKTMHKWVNLKSDPYDAETGIKMNVGAFVVTVNFDPTNIAIDKARKMPVFLRLPHIFNPSAMSAEAVIEKCVQEINQMMH